MKTSETKLKENGYTHVLTNTYFEESIYSKKIGKHIIIVNLFFNNTFKINYTKFINEPRLHLLLAKEIKKLEVRK